MANTYQGACGRVPSVRPGANFKEAVCIDTNRVYDSVSDKNCLEDLQVTFPDDVQSIVNNCCSLKLKEVEVENVYMDVEPIPFQKLVDMVLANEIEDGKTQIMILKLKLLKDMGKL